MTLGAWGFEWMTSVRVRGVQKKKDHKLNTLVFHQQKGEVIGRLPRLNKQKRWKQQLTRHGWATTWAGGGVDRPNSSFLCIFLCEENGGFQQSGGVGGGGEATSHSSEMSLFPACHRRSHICGELFLPLPPSRFLLAGALITGTRRPETRAAEVTVLFVALETGCCPGFIQRQDPLGSTFYGAVQYNALWVHR